MSKSRRRRAKKPQTQPGASQPKISQKAERQSTSDGDQVRSQSYCRALPRSGRDHLPGFRPNNSLRLFNYDDSYYVYQNPLISNGLTRAGFINAFHSPAGRQLASANLHLAHARRAMVSGSMPADITLVNVILHALAAILLLLRVAQNDRRSFGVAPGWRRSSRFTRFRAESVVWISERKDVLSAVFFFTGLIFYARYAAKPTLGRYLPSPLALTLGLLSKAMLVTISVPSSLCSTTGRLSGSSSGVSRLMNLVSYLSGDLSRRRFHFFSWSLAFRLRPFSPRNLRLRRRSIFRSWHARKTRL